MKKAILITHIVFLTLFFGLLTVYGQEGQGNVPLKPAQPTISSTPRLMMRLMDLNNDGRISEEESKKFFADADQDNDGFVTVREIMALMSKRQTAVNGPNIGQDAPDFALATLESNNTIRLSDFKEKDIVVLVFGSYTSPMFRSQAGNLEKIYQQYKSKSKWFFIYVKEANPADISPAEENIKAGITINQPKTMEERQAVAKRCYTDMGFSFPALVDGIDNATANTYAAEPERMYIVDKRGRIVYKSEKGPEGFKPDDMAQTLARLCST